VPARGFPRTAQRLHKADAAGHPRYVTDKTVELDLDDVGLATDLPRPQDSRDEVQQVPYRPVQFRDDDLPTALERCAAWLRSAQEWLGEPLDVIAVHLDYDDRAGAPYYEVKLLCNEEDLAGAPIAMRRAVQDGPPVQDGATAN
jgi:hypothetical protein